MSEDNPERVDPESAQTAEQFGEKVEGWADRLVNEAGVDPHDVATTLITVASQFGCRHFGPADTARWLYAIADELATVPPREQH